MVTREDFDDYLLRLGVDYEELDDGLWVIRSDEATSVVVSYSPPLALLRLKVMELPKVEEARPKRISIKVR